MEVSFTEHLQGGIHTRKANSSSWTPPHHPAECFLGSLFRVRNGNSQGDVRDRDRTRASLLTLGQVAQPLCLRRRRRDSNSPCPGVLQIQGENSQKEVRTGSVHLLNISCSHLIIILLLSSAWQPHSLSRLGEFCKRKRACYIKLCWDGRRELGPSQTDRTRRP